MAGSEAAVTPVGIAGFAAMKALSTRNDEPERASRPFDAKRDGFVLGEGAATLVLEEQRVRAAPGRACTGRAARLWRRPRCVPHDPAAPDRRRGCAGHAAPRIADAGLSPADIDYVNAHGTSTPPNDKVETHALKRVFGTHMPLVSSTKSMTGHTLGAAGALESVFCVLAIQSSLVPPTINLEYRDPACDLDYIANSARPAKVRVAMNNSLGFGGHNASLVFGEVASDGDREAGSRS